jgi:hypothetical protein
LQTVQRQSGLEVLHAQRHSALVLPAHSKVIVVLDDVCDLSRDDQHGFLIGSAVTAVESCPLRRVLRMPWFAQGPSSSGCTTT